MAYSAPSLDMELGYFCLFCVFRIIAERQSVRRINDALGRFYSTLVYVRTYVYLSVTLGKDRHIHTVTLGKDRHIHIRIYACAHGLETEETALE